MSPERRRLVVGFGAVTALAASHDVITHSLGMPNAAFTALIAATEIVLIAALVKLNRREGCRPIWERLRTKAPLTDR
jgi:hypothetical protein